jgi:CheY-like chemotaxis protein
LLILATMEGPDPRGTVTREVDARPRRRRRVLFVEDNLDTRDIYAWCMRAAGWEVDTVTDGLEAVPVAALFQPDVVVMDLHLLAVDGIEATRRLKADARTAHIPVVACTAYGRQYEAELRGRFRLVVSKPCDPDDLRVLLEDLVAGWEP